MGCAQSKEEVVLRCRTRKRLMKQLVAHLHSLGNAYAEYLQSLKNTGAALRQFGEGEDEEQTGHTLTPQQQQHFSSLPQPPPLPRISSPIHIGPSTTAIQQEEHDYSPPSESVSRSGTPPPPSPPRDSVWYILNPFCSVLHPNEDDKARGGTLTERCSRMLYEEGVPDLEQLHVHEEEYAERQSNRGALVVTRTGSRTLMEVVKNLDDQFLKAFDGGQEVYRLLQARKAVSTPMFRGSNGNRFQGNIFSSLTSNWSRPTRGEIHFNRDDIEGTASGQAVTLDRILEWERKLRDEVRGVVTIRSEHQKSCENLRHYEAKADQHAVHRTEAQIKNLYSEILVSFQGINSIIVAIQSLRDEELYPQLVQLVEALANMWRIMYGCHLQQKHVAIDLRNPNASFKTSPTSEFHHKSVIQLEKVLENWYQSFRKLVGCHREYMAILSEWLRLTLVPIKTEIRDTIADSETESPQTTPPKIIVLCEEWQQAVDGMPDKVASEAIKSLVAVVHTMIEQQSEEMRQKQKADNVARQLEQRVSALESFERKCTEASSTRRTLAARSNDEEGDRRKEEGEREIWGGGESSEGEETIEPRGEDVVRAMSIARGPAAERKAALDAFKRVVENERTKYCKYVRDTRVLTINNLQTGLPGVFEAMAGFSAVCVQSYQNMCEHHRRNSSCEYSRD